MRPPWPQSDIGAEVNDVDGVEWTSTKAGYIFAKQHGAHHPDLR